MLGRTVTCSTSLGKCDNKCPLSDPKGCCKSPVGTFTGQICDKNQTCFDSTLCGYRVDQSSGAPVCVVSTDPTPGPGLFSTKTECQDSLSICRNAMSYWIDTSTQFYCRVHPTSSSPCVTRVDYVDAGGTWTKWGDLITGSGTSAVIKVVNGSTATTMDITARPIRCLVNASPYPNFYQYWTLHPPG